MQTSKRSTSRKDQILVGLVGRIGAGKSTVARLMAARGARVIDADRIAHDVLVESDVAGEIAALLGPEALGADGAVDRRALASLVFGDTSTHHHRLEGLESIIHPRVRARIMEMLEHQPSVEADRSEGARIVVLDIPLLMHGGWAERCDWLVRVECDDRTRLSRLAARGWSETEVRARDAAWDARNTPDRRLPDHARLATVDASLDASYTDRAVESLWHRIDASGRSSPPPP